MRVRPIGEPGEALKCELTKMYSGANFLCSDYLNNKECTVNVLLLANAQRLIISE